jgi:hypothetical protein
MPLIDVVLRRPELAEAPPVLVDIGASGHIHASWRRLAPYSICIAFDPDARDMGHTAESERRYRQLHVVPAIVSVEPYEQQKFYLTRSPYCSSALLPRDEQLAHWAFADLFTVERTVSLPAVQLSAVLESLGLDRVDWFKSDSQGTDLRLFDSLGPAVARGVVAAEFEPGIIDAYLGEDKLTRVLDRMLSSGFWLARMKVFGSQRIHQDYFKRLPNWQRRYIHALLPAAPGWAEVTFLRDFQSCSNSSPRQHLLAWVIATLHAEHGFAMEVADRGHQEFRDGLFQRLYDHSRLRLRWQARRLPASFASGLWQRFRRALP